MPEEAENYIHRIGRTGRADAKGNAITFITKREAATVDAIEKLMNLQIPRLELPQVLEISDVLTKDEMPQLDTMNVQDKYKKKLPKGGGAFHEKLQKNRR